MTPRPPEIRHGLTTVEIDRIINVHDALVKALRALVSDPFSFAMDPDGDCFLCGDPTAGDPDQADHDTENPDCAAAKARALLRDLDAASQQEEAE